MEITFKVTKVTGSLRSSRRFSNLYFKITRYSQKQCLPLKIFELGLVREDSSIYIFCIDRGINESSNYKVASEKAGFHMIANDRKESCFDHILADDRRADCSHTFRSAEMSNVLARCARGKIKANNMADVEEEILLQANLFLLLVLKRRQTSVLDS